MRARNCVLTLSRSISVQELQRITRKRPNWAIAYAYIRYIERRTVHDVLAALLCQLISSDEAAFELIKERYIQCEADGEGVSPQDIIDLLRELINLFERVLVVIDGLDEALSEIQEKLLRSLVLLGVSLLITCRPLPLLKCHTPGASNVSIEARTQDIELFVSQQLEQNARFRCISKLDSTLADQLSARIKEKSKGM